MSDQDETNNFDPPKMMDGLKQILQAEPDENTEPMKTDEVRPFHYIRKANPNHLIYLIWHELPQTIAVVLSHLDPPKASVILQNLPVEIQSDVFHRIINMKFISPGILREVERVLEKKLCCSDDDDANAGGLESGVEILKWIDSSTEKHILISLKDGNLKDCLIDKFTTSMPFLKRIMFKQKIRSLVKKDRRNTND